MLCIAVPSVAPNQEWFDICPKMFDTYHCGLTHLTQTGVSQEVLHGEPVIFQEQIFSRLRQTLLFDWEVRSNSILVGLEVTKKMSPVLIGSMYTW